MKNEEESVDKTEEEEGRSSNDLHAVPISANWILLLRNGSCYFTFLFISLLLLLFTLYSTLSNAKSTRLRYIPNMIPIF